MPAVVYVEFLVGFALAADHTVEDGRRALAWIDEIAPIDEKTADASAAVVSEVIKRGHALTGIDAVVAGVAHERGAPVVTDDNDLTIDAVRAVIDVETY